MKRKIVIISVAIVICVLSSINITLNNSETDNINLKALYNKALAQSEVPGDPSTCGQGSWYFCGYFSGIPYLPAYQDPWTG